MATNQKERVLLLVLNDFLKFDRKIYQVFGLRLGRPLKLKTLLYFLVLVLIEAVLYFNPILGWPLRAMPEAFLLVIPGFLAYLLADIPAEGRMPLAYVRSFLLYHYRKLKRVTYRRGREISKPATYRFSGYATAGSPTKEKPFRGKKMRVHPRILVSPVRKVNADRKEITSESHS